MFYSSTTREAHLDKYASLDLLQLNVQNISHNDFQSQSVLSLSSMITQFAEHSMRERIYTDRLQSKIKVNIQREARKEMEEKQLNKVPAKLF